MPGKIEGSVVSITEAGNLVTDIAADQLVDVPRGGDDVSVKCDEHETNGIFDDPHGQPAATLVAVVGTSGHLELEIVGISASDMLGIRVGEKVLVQW